MSISRRIVLFAGIVLPVLLITLFSYSRIRKNSLEKLYAERSSIASLAASVLKEKFNRLRDLGVSFASRPVLCKYAEEGNWEAAIQVMKQVPVDFPYIIRSFITDTSGILRADMPHIPDNRGKCFSHRDFFKGVKKSNEPYLSEVYRRDAAPRLIVTSLACPIKNSSGIILGYLVLQVTVDKLLDWSTEISIGQSGYVYIVDQNGHIAASPQYQKKDTIIDYSLVPAVLKALNGEKKVEVLYNPIEKENRLSAYEPIPGFGWAVIVQQEEKAALSGQRDLNTILLVYSIAVLLAVAFALIIIREMNLRGKAENELSAANAGLELRIDERTAEIRLLTVNLEQKVIERTEQLESVNKELEAFSYSVSHDLRAPLRAVNGYAQMLNEDYGSKMDDEGKRIIGVIRYNATKMGTLIDDLLAFSRLGRKEVQKTLINMNELVEGVLIDIDKSIPHKAEIIVNKLDDVKADYGLLHQVMFNLISNAIKYSSKKEKPCVEIMSEEKNGELIFTVKDNGAGFNMKYYDKLFGVFQRLHTSDEFEGTGVGLAIVQRIIAKHGGRVWAEGKVNDGSLFNFSLKYN